MPTGVLVKKGKYFRVETGGKLWYTDDKGKEVAMSPDGHGYWTWFVLKVKIGNDTWDVGSRGGNYAKADGMIELGAPRTYTFLAEDGKNVSGAWSVMVFAEGGIQAKNVAGTNPTVSKKERINTDLTFLNLLSTGAQVANRDPGEIAAELKRIILQYKLLAAGSGATVDDFITSVKQYHEYYYNRVGSPTAREKSRYNYYLNELIAELQDKIDKNQL